MEAYSLLALKLLMGILGLVLQINLLGKGNLAPTSAMDQVQNYVLGGIIGGVIYSDSVGLLQFFLVLILWTLLVLSLKFIKNHNHWVKSVIDGKSVWVIVNGEIQTEECMKNGISAHDLMFKLRAAGIYEIAAVKRAVMEQNGQLTVIQYGDESLRYPLITDGQIDHDILEIIKRLLSDDGSLWITIDDNEAHYLKVLCDEVFGRGNFIANIVWNHRKSVQSDIVISLSHNHLLVFAKSKDKVTLNRLQLVDADKYSNPDNDPRGLWYATPFDAPNIRPNLTYPITNPNTGEEYLPPKGRCWRTTQEEYLKALADNRIVFGKTGKSKPQMKRFLSEAQSKGSSVKTWWDDAGTATEGTTEQGYNKIHIRYKSGTVSSKD